ncbi:polysaccharide lyase family 1 protein [Dothidotthia symphoricarpi CBS 119687]|uniref:pectate lyase n=1 Tax=Dothidotthia symphoricarpi CBS 119687 TaxID=1392245 RepID=A0A6A6ACY1_9PLEO|nr:polysaccharide lyase family 1 protein [Dothidotthia symphoricarpi CBS 119687]KAF2128834.1 polysaccharide lyase family 1 protein [Dothidotthia symphoricarpi CBS 119687]
MKFSTIVSVGLTAITALAAPTPSISILKRASIAKRAVTTSDIATTGYATENGGTTGGKGGSTIEVASLDELTSAVEGDDAAIVLVTGPISGDGDTVKVGSNKSVIGKDSTAVLTNVGLIVKSVSNVIIRNLAIEKVVGADAIGIQLATNVWVDHVDLSSDQTHDKDYYDGLLDVTHASDWVTVSNSYIHDHWKASLVGHSDSNGDEDTGHLTVTYHNNYFQNLNSRGPSYRFGTGHIYNNYYDTVSDGINTRDGAQLLVQNNVFVSSKKALYSTDSGYAVASGNDFGDSENTAEEGTFTAAPYTVDTLLDAADVEAAVVGTAGVTLSF